MVLKVEEEEKERIDKYLAKHLDYSRSLIAKMLEDEFILVNGKKIKANYVVKENDEISIKDGYVEEIDIKPENIPINIIYEDNDIIIVNKESGMVVHPGSGNFSGTLVNALMYYTNNLSDINGEVRPGVVHRIDKDTSGLIIIAKNDKAHINLSEQIKDRKVKKIYKALVRGVIPEEVATINMPIGRSKIDRKKMAVRSDGKEAITHIKVIKRYDKYTLIEVKIDTGRTHQIRVHMAEIGYPVVGDEVYSNGKNDFGVHGQMLHSFSLGFKHPITGKELHFEAPLPEYFANIIKSLEE